MRGKRDGALGTRLHQHWTLRDAERYEPFTFRPNDRKAILLELKPRPSKKAADALIHSLEDCVIHFNASRRFEGKLAADGLVRRQLTTVLKRADQLQAAMSQLDWGARRTLAPYHGSGKPPPPMPLRDEPQSVVEILEDDLCDASEILVGVTRAIQTCLVMTKPRTGRRRALAARAVFATQIAHSLQTLVPDSIKITAVAGKSFENILTICLDAATGAATGDVHRIASEAIKSLQSSGRSADVKRPPQPR